MREVPSSTTKAKSRKSTASFAGLFFMTMLAAGIPSTLSAEEVTPAGNSKVIYNLGTSDNVTTWLGIAASSNGRVFRNVDRSGEVVARDRTMSECEQTTGRTCQAIAVPVSWQVAAVACRRASEVAVFVGGSAQNAAERIALDKGNRAGFDDNHCRTIYSK